MSRKGGSWLLAGVPALFLVSFFALPNALLLTVSFLKSDAQYLTDEVTLDNYAFVLSRRSIWKRSCGPSPSALPSACSMS